MKNNISLAIFETHKIRRYFDEKTETWYFSVIDIVAALTEQLDYNRAKTYWTTLKNRLKNEGSEVVTKCDRLKMMAQDGKMRETDVADVETILRLIQSVPSKKAEPTEELPRLIKCKDWKKIKFRQKRVGELPKMQEKRLKKKQASLL